MSKVTPDPPEADKASASHHSDDAIDHGSDETHLSYADIRAIPRTPSPMFIVNPEVDVEELLSFSSEGLASACVIIMDQADRETGTTRNTLLGVHMIMSAIEISVNRALDHLEPIG